MKEKKVSRRKFLGITAAACATATSAGIVSLSGESNANEQHTNDLVVPDKSKSIEPAVPKKTQKTVTEKAKSIPVLAQTDVLVVGSGPSGLAAALAAAKEGVDVLLLERYGFFGGVITQAAMGSIAWYRYANTVDAGGIQTEFENKAKEMGASIDQYALMKKVPFVTGIMEKQGLIVDGKQTYELLDTEMFKYVADTMLLESGAVPVLHCLAVDAVMEGNTIKGVITESKSGRMAILAKRVIDATGDADIANFAGVPFRKDPKEKLHAVTTNFSCSNINTWSFLWDQMMDDTKVKDLNLKTSGKEDEMSASIVMREPFEKAKKAGILEEDWVTVGLWDGLTPEGEMLSTNAVHMEGIDSTDVLDLTKAEIQGRYRSIHAMNALRKFQPGFSNARIRNFQTQIGTRESRKIKGTYDITEHDIKNQARFDDSIGVCPEFIDGFGLLYFPTTGRYFQIPYGIMLPQTIDNLLVAGRAVAGDKNSHAATRQMVCCMATGQGAGVAAAISLKEKVTCRSVNISVVQKQLKKQGVRIA